MAVFNFMNQRGTAANIPVALPDGVFYWAEDTGKLYIGTAASGNVIVNNIGGASPTFTGTASFTNITVSGTTSFASGSVAQAAVNGLVSDLALLAPLASPAFSGTVTVGTLGFFDTGEVLSLQGNTNSYSQAENQNTNSGAVASADWIVSNNLGTATTFYGDFGINSSTFSGSGAYSAPNAVYLSSTSGDLAIGTTTPGNAIHFFVNGGTTDAMTVSAAGVVSFPGTVVLGTPVSGNLANCTFPTLNQNTSGSSASCTGNAATATMATASDGLASATTTVAVSAATAPTAGQVLTATSSTAASWQAASGGLTGWVDVTKQAAPVLTTNSDTTNSTNIAAIISAAASGSTIYFPPGTYKFASAISPGTKSFMFQGAGSGQAGSPSVIYTILCTTSATADLVTLTDNYWYTSFADICFSTTVTKTAGNMVTTGTASGVGNVGVNFRRCNFNGTTQGTSGVNLFNGIVFAGTNSGNQCDVEDCQFTNFTQYGISVLGNTTTNGNSISLVVENTTIQGQLASGNAAAAMQVTQCGAIQIDNCDFIGAVNNLLMNPTTGQGVFSLACTNSFFDNSFGSCIKITGLGTTERIKFSSCGFTVAAGGAYNAFEISCSGTTGASGIDLNNCNFFNTFANTTSGTNGISLVGTQDVSIHDCRIAGWGNAGQAGILVTPYTGVVTKPDIQNCVIGPTGGYGANTIGISLTAGAIAYASIVVANNNMNGNTTAMTDASSITATSLANVSRTIVNNLGYLVNTGRGVVTPTIPATTVPVFNPNGCTCSVWIIAGTLTVVKVGNATTPYAAAVSSPGIPVRVGANESLAVTFTVAPTSWVWVPEG